MSANHSLHSYLSPEIGARSWLIPARIDTPELLDCGAGTHREVAENLADMWRLNRYFGGFRALTHHLYPRLSEGPVTVVDLGAGSAQMLVAIVRWARARQTTVRVIGVDWSSRNLDVARRHVAAFPEILLLRADALRLPYPLNSADYIISSLFLHHFTPDQVVRLLQTAYVTARRGVIMTDLVRGWLPLIGFKLLQPLFARNFLTRHDGEVSIRRAYTPSELADLALAAGLPRVQVYTHFPWRMTLVADK